jgi:hypothetical protein
MREKKKAAENAVVVRREPVQKFRRGSVEAAIWENQTGDRVWHNVTICRRYKTDRGEYREAPTYALSDLVQVGRVAELAESWISQRLDEFATVGHQADV